MFNCTYNFMDTNVTILRNKPHGNKDKILMELLAMNQ